jgi:hypothetical protein
MVLKAELDAPAGSAGIFATVRHRIEMMRRALDIRITADEDIHEASQDDRRLIDTIRRRLRDARAILKSCEAIRKSRDLLTRFDTSN